MFKTLTSFLHFFCVNFFIIYFHIFMDSESKSLLIAELLEFGFDETYVLKAVQLTSDKETAAIIIMKLVQEGPNADLSQFVPIHQPPMVQGPVSVVKPNRAKMLLVVNGELKMGKGKICAQVGHAVIGAYLQIQEMARFDERSRLRLHSWENTGGAKIVVKSKDLKEIKQVQQKLRKMQMGINLHLVQDAGHTQIASGSKTVLAIGPAFSDQIDPATEHLKLL